MSCVRDGVSETHIKVVEKCWYGACGQWEVVVMVKFFFNSECVKSLNWFQCTTTLHSVSDPEFRSRLRVGDYVFGHGIVSLRTRTALHTDVSFWRDDC